VAKKDISTALATEVRALRTALGLSQEELAARAGLHRNYVGMIERLERNPTLTAIEGLAKGLKVRPSELVAKAGVRCGWQK
jgi:transcriptional regulator with XRE-family HTH domain